MRVAHRDDYDTHAVIGGKGVQEFGIAQTAEFFTVLSNTLYSNKPLAVIREVLCNAWDAHIVAGKTDTPVVITIDEDKLSIRDHGHGIPHDLIHTTYCVYGNSTKENDGNQTGGFGLGSKAPFAYSDHFTVNNHHAMLKTVHAISRGSALTQGKPDRRVMVSVPTMETGVEVVIPVKNKADMHQFIEKLQDLQPQSLSNKQGREGEFDGQKAVEVRDLLHAHSLKSYQFYEWLISDEIDLARELARMSLPVNFYTEMYWKIDLHNLFHFLMLRADSHAQKEIRVYAELLEYIVAKWVPYAFDAYRVYRKGAITFSAHEALMIRAALAMPSLSVDEKPVWANQLSMREWKAFVSKIDRIT